MSDVQVGLQALFAHPVKSCAGIALTESVLVETGLEFDRAWMLVDSRGNFVSQRDLAQMALVRPVLRTFDMVLRAPGMLALHIALDTVEQPVRVTVCGDAVAAYDMGDLAARWFSGFLGCELRMVRFDPAQKRLSDPPRPGAVGAETAFTDTFPLHIVSAAALDELNRRLASHGHDAVTMARFRPNLVLDGLDAHAEDHLDEIAFEADGGPVRLKLAAPCVRCPIPDVDPLTAQRGHAVGDALAGYRADARLGGAITFGMVAVIVEGVDRVLRVGMRGSASYRFD